MEFLNRQAEQARLDRLAAADEAGLAVLWGRRRIGKTRLLLEWVKRHDGVYWVADESSAPVQRRYLAQTLERPFPGFADVEYPDWESLLRRLGREAVQRCWRGPIVLDELPYLILSSPELPSLLQRWIDHEAPKARLKVVLAGSSQRMMQGLVLNANAPLYGRATELLKLEPLSARYIGRALGIGGPRRVVESYALWGGIPRYWELARPFGDQQEKAAVDLVLDPMGPLHEEPARLLMEESPPAFALRPLLDAIGMGAHRLTEIGARLGTPATSLTRPLARLQEMDLVHRETPFGASEKSGKRSLYRIADPFFRFWFRTVASQRGLLAETTRAVRRRLLHQTMPGLCSEAWEELVRRAIPQLDPDKSALGRHGPWGPARRFWHGNQPEWDVVAQSVEGKMYLLGEVKWPQEKVTTRYVEKTVQSMLSRDVPGPLKKGDASRLHYALFLPEPPARMPPLPAHVQVVDGEFVMGNIR